MAGCFIAGFLFLPTVVLVASLYIIVTRLTTDAAKRIARKLKKRP